MKTNPREKAIQIKDVYMIFDDHFPVLNGVTLDILRNKITAIVGPSGCGKTVLFWLIASFIKPTRGKILIDEKIAPIPDSSRIMIFQNYALFPWKDAVGNVEYALESCRMSPIEKRKKSLNALEMVGLKKFASWPIHKLSGGMQQRVALARAIVTKSKIWLLDEPFSALDVFNKDNVEKLIIYLQRKTKATIIFVTHRIGEAIKLSDQTVVMSHRPSKIKKIFDTSLLKDHSDIKFIKVRTQILKILKSEYNKSLEKQKDEYILNHLITRKEFL